MNSILDSLQEAGKKSIKSVSSMATSSYSYVADSAEAARRSTAKLTKAMSAYVKSDVFENDLDTVINYLHIHNSKGKPKFSSENRHERVTQKSNYVKDQTVKFIATMGLYGSMAGRAVAGPKGDVVGFAVGTATGVVIVTVVAGTIIVKRVAEFSDVEGLVLV